jgi:hypothetical protein
MNEYILVYPGFARSPGWCHVVVADNGQPGVVLVGDLEDNPGTSVVNATEQIGTAISQRLFNGASADDFAMFEYYTGEGSDIAPTFLRVGWKGQLGHFSMPTWTSVDPAEDPRLRSISDRVRPDRYTFDALTTERDLELIDISTPDEVVDRARARTVSPKEFREAMTPTIHILRALTSAVDELVARVPNVDSQALREIEAEPQLRTRSPWENPVTETHMYGAVTLQAATDNARTFAEAFDAQKPPLYGHLSLARATLEASVVAAWLNEPGIAYEERVKRGMCERLYSAAEVAKLGIKTDAEETLAEYVADAVSLGWQTSFDDDGKPSVDGTSWPSIPEGITSLLARGGGGNPGPLLWSRLSAVSHAVWWGLEWALDLSSALPVREGHARVSIGTETAKVAIPAIAILRALRASATDRFTLMGWNDDPDWHTASGEAEAHERILYETFIQGAGDSD